MSASLRRSLSSDKKLLLVTAEATSLIQEILVRTGALPAAMIHIGQAALGALLLQALNDPAEKENVELQWKVDGVFGDLVAFATSFGQVRSSIANPARTTQKLDVGLGRGVFSCRRTKNNTSSSGLVESEASVSLDIENYLRQSEQKNCAVGMSVKFALKKNDQGEEVFFVDLARAYLIHFLPEEDGNVIEMESLDHHLKQLGPLSQWVVDDDASMATTTMAKFITGNKDVTELHEITPEFKCTCSREKVLQALSLLTTGERKHLFEDQKDFVEVKCEFCAENYQLPSDEIESFLKK